MPKEDALKESIESSQWWSEMCPPKKQKLYCPICQGEMVHTKPSKATDEEVIWSCVCSYCDIVVYIHHFI